MTLTSTVTVFPPKVIGRAMKIIYGEKGRLSNAVRMVGNRVMGGDTRTFQQGIDITEVASPSSTIV